MCLCFTTKRNFKEERMNGFASSPKPKIANKDIICYKVVNFKTEKAFLLRTGEKAPSKKSFVTPYQDFPIEFGKRYHEDNNFDIDCIGVNLDDEECYDWEVNGGGFHSFVNLNGARADASYQNSSWRGNCFVVYAIIPKGTEYYEGTFCSDKTYISKDIIYTYDVAWMQEKTFEKGKDVMLMANLNFVFNTKNDGKKHHLLCLKEMQSKDLAELTYDK